VLADEAVSMGGWHVPFAVHYRVVIRFTGERAEIKKMTTKETSLTKLRIKLEQYFALVNKRLNTVGLIRGKMALRAETDR